MRQCKTVHLGSLVRQKRFRQRVLPLYGDTRRYPTLRKKISVSPRNTDIVLQRLKVLNTPRLLTSALRGETRVCAVQEEAFTL